MVASVGADVSHVFPALAPHYARARCRMTTASAYAWRPMGTQD